MKVDANNPKSKMLNDFESTFIEVMVSMGIQEEKSQQIIDVLEKAEERFVQNNFVWIPLYKCSST